MTRVKEYNLRRDCCHYGRPCALSVTRIRQKAKAEGDRLHGADRSIISEARREGMQSEGCPGHDVIVSGFSNGTRCLAQILDMLTEAVWNHVDDRVLAEYDSVLRRPAPPISNRCC